MGAPHFYVAYHGHERPDAVVSANKLSFLDGTFQKHRVEFPEGYAPLSAKSIDGHLARIDWDDERGRPRTNWVPNAEEEAKLRSLFQMREGYVEPFPVSYIDRIAAPARQVARSPKGTQLAFAVVVAIALVLWMWKSPPNIDTLRGRVAAGLAVSSLAGIIATSVLVLWDVRDSVALLSVSFFYGIFVLALIFLPRGATT